MHPAQAAGDLIEDTKLTCLVVMALISWSRTDALRAAS